MCFQSEIQASVRQRRIRPRRLAQRAPLRRRRVDIAVTALISDLRESPI